MRRESESLPDLRTSDGRLVATRAELDVARGDVLHGGSDGGRFSMLWGMDGWEVVPIERLPRLAYEARELLGWIDLLGREIGEGKRPMSDLRGWGRLSAGTRRMLERIRTLATEEAFEQEQAAWRAEATTEPPDESEPDVPSRPTRSVRRQIRPCPNGIRASAREIAELFADDERGRAALIPSHRPDLAPGEPVVEAALPRPPVERLAAGMPG